MYKWPISEFNSLLLNFVKVKKFKVVFLSLSKNSNICKKKWSWAEESKNKNTELWFVDIKEDTFKDANTTFYFTLGYSLWIFLAHVFVTLRNYPRAGLHIRKNLFTNHEYLLVMLNLFLQGWSITDCGCVDEVFSFGHFPPLVFSFL